MAEELRFFVRIALFMAIIATIYWFVSYEEAGTILLAAVFAGAAIFIGIVAVTVRRARLGGRGLEALLGFTDTETERPLELQEDVFPAASLWPASASIAATLIGLGLIYGAWLWIPGLAMALAGAWGWLTESLPKLS